MKKILSLLFILMIAPAYGNPGFKERFFEQLDRRQFGAMEGTLRDWKRSTPHDPELPVAYGYYFYNKALKGKPTLLAAPAARETLIATHPFAPETTAFRYHTVLDKKLAQKAVQNWKEALGLSPGRLDIYFDLADLYQDEGDFEAQNRILGLALQYADKGEEEMKWVDDGELPRPLDRFLTESLQSYVDYYFSLAQSQSDEKAYRLAKLMITFYPRDPAGYNSMAAYFSFKRDWEHTLKYLLVANLKAPKDSLVLGNIAKLLERMHKKPEARIYWRKVIRLNNDETNVEFAKARLEKLGQKEEVRDKP